ncbi:MAG: DNA alkylation repair protein [Bacteroidales bacterium]|nr:DNA alkylation repair protein [Bacteroidales bacterium]
MINNLIAIQNFTSWLNSQNSFQRRTVPVTFIKYIKKNKPDFKEVFHFLQPLMTDPDREVQQGIGWFLREAWKINASSTENFLLEWKNTAPRLIFQYACEKMSTENKQRFKREK